MAKLSFNEKNSIGNRSCETCDIMLVRTFGEANARWLARRFCSVACFGVSRRVPLEHRFFAKVDSSPGYGPNGECHIWTGARSTCGYGAVQIDGKTVPAHRTAWVLANGQSVPDGMHVMHSCDNPICVNPAHLTPGTPRENMLDKTIKRRGNAPSGEKSGVAKITANDARAIFADTHPNSVIARDYSVSASMITKIKKGRAWRVATGAS